MVYWEKAPREVIKLAESLIDEFHPWLKNASIGFMFRSEAPKQNGKEVWGKAEKVSDKWREMLDEPLDFVIWIAKDIWEDKLDFRQKKALVDHELMHCFYDGIAHIRPHDVEEFTCIVERHGLWRGSLEQISKAASAYHQSSLFSDGLGKGKVVSVKVSTAPFED